MKNFSEQQLQSAVERAGLEQSVFLRIRSELCAQPENKPGFEVAHIAYYLGALLIKKNEAALTRYLYPIIPARVKHRHPSQLA